jgi:hypothetical protein
MDAHEKIAFTGCEQLWAVDADAEILKREMTLIEDMDELGRLFDIDVLDTNGVKLSRDSRGIERTCLICGGPVRACARSRAHTADELFARAHQVIDGYFLKADASRIAMAAQRALLTEAIVTPKPGLVDRENSGAHTDMDLFTFADSACVLRDYFEKCAGTGLAAGDTEPDVLFEKLRYHGLNAEEQMLGMTHGVNTHKGALFSLGILCCAAGMPGDIFENAARIAKSGTNLIIRTPVIPSFNDSADEIAAIARFASSLPNVKEMHILPYHRIGQDKYAGLGREYTLSHITPPTGEHMEGLLRVVNSYGLQGKIGG